MFNSHFHFRFFIIHIFHYYIGFFLSPIFVLRNSSFIAERISVSHDLKSWIWHVLVFSASFLICSLRSHLVSNISFTLTNNFFVSSLSNTEKNSVSRQIWFNLVFFSITLQTSLKTNVDLLSQHNNHYSLPVMKIILFQYYPLGI